MVRFLTRFGALAALFLSGSLGLNAQVLTAPAPGTPTGAGPAPVMPFSPGLMPTRGGTGPTIGPIKSNLPGMGRAPGVSLAPGMNFAPGVGLLPGGVAPVLPRTGVGVPTLPLTLIPESNVSPAFQGMPQFEEYSIKSAPMESPGSRKDLPPTAGPAGLSRELAVKAEALRKPLKNAAELSGATSESAEGLGRKVMDVMLAGGAGRGTGSELRPDPGFGATVGNFSAKDARLTAWSGKAGGFRSSGESAAVPSKLGEGIILESGELSPWTENVRSSAKKRVLARVVPGSDPITLAGGVALIVMEISRERLSLTHVSPARTESSEAPGAAYRSGPQDDEGGIVAWAAPQRADYRTMTLQAFDRAGRAADPVLARMLAEDAALETLPLLRGGAVVYAEKEYLKQGENEPARGLSAAAKYGLPFLLWPFFPLLSLAFDRSRN